VVLESPEVPEVEAPLELPEAEVELEVPPVELVPPSGETHAPLGAHTNPCGQGLVGLHG
jgi:hypothetical protein